MTFGSSVRIPNHCFLKSLRGHISPYLTSKHSTTHIQFNFKKWKKKCNWSLKPNEIKQNNRKFLMPCSAGILFQWLLWFYYDRHDKILPYLWTVLKTWHFPCLATFRSTQNSTCCSRRPECLFCFPPWYLPVSPRPYSPWCLPHNLPMFDHLLKPIQCHTCLLMYHLHSKRGSPLPLECNTLEKHSPGKKASHIDKKKKKISAYKICWWACSHWPRV